MIPANLVVTLACSSPSLPRYSVIDFVLSLATPAVVALPDVDWVWERFNAVFTVSPAHLLSAP